MLVDRRRQIKASPPRSVLRYSRVTPGTRLPIAFALVEVDASDTSDEGSAERMLPVSPACWPRLCKVKRFAAARLLRRISRRVGRRTVMTRPRALPLHRATRRSEFNAAGVGARDLRCWLNRSSTSGGARRHPLSEWVDCASTAAAGERSPVRSGNVGGRRGLRPRSERVYGYIRRRRVVADEPNLAWLLHLRAEGTRGKQRL
jgi:hypothetical protein